MPLLHQWIHLGWYIGSEASGSVFFPHKRLHDIIWNPESYLGKLPSQCEIDFFYILQLKCKGSSTKEYSCVVMGNGKCVLFWRPLGSPLTRTHNEVFHTLYSEVHLITQVFWKWHCPLVHGNSIQSLLW